MTANRLLIALTLLVVLSIGLPRLVSNRSNSGAPVGTIDIAGMPVEGAADARVALVEFSDYECPYCARNATTVFPELRKRFISTGKIRYVFANFPLPNHPNAKPLAAAAVCAGKQDAYWEMHDELFGKRPRTAENILDLGKRMGLQMQPFEQCLGNDGPLTDRIRSDQQIAREFQISATPTFVLGVTDTQGRVEAKDIIVGAQPLTVFESAIADLLGR